MIECADKACLSEWQRRQGLPAMQACRRQSRHAPGLIKPDWQLFTGDAAGSPCRATRSPGVVVLDAQLGGEHARPGVGLEGVRALRVAAGGDDGSGGHQAGHGVVQARHGGCGACCRERSSAKRAAVPAGHGRLYILADMLRL